MQCDAMQHIVTQHRGYHAVQWNINNNEYITLAYLNGCQTKVKNNSFAGYSQRLLSKYTLKFDSFSDPIYTTTTTILMPVWVYASLLEK